MCHLTRLWEALFHLSGLRFLHVTADPYPRNLTFSSSYNFRDVGGYAGLDGRTVRWRRLFRADSLHRLKGADWEAFAALGVRSVIDLRRPFEVEEHGRVAEAEDLAYLNLVLEHVDWERRAAPGGRGARALAGRPLSELHRGRPDRAGRRARR